MRVGINILFLIPGEVGGSETYVMNTLQALCRKPDDVELILFTNRENDELFTERFAANGGTSTSLLDFSARSRVTRVLREQFELPRRAVSERVDVLWSPGYTAPLSCPVPQVVSILDMQYRSFPEDMSWPYRTAIDFLVQRGAMRCDAITTLSEFARTEITRYTRAPVERITVTHLGVDEMSRGGAAGRAVDFDESYILCVADSHPHKNLPALVKAFAQLKGRIPQNLVLLGRARAGESDLRRVIIESGCQDRVTRLDYIKRNELAALYRDADVFVFPSLYEGFGLPVLEAMKASVPVVTTRCGAIPEVGGDAVIYFDHTSQEDLTEKISSTIDLSAEARGQLIARASERASGFTWEASAEKLMSVLRKVADPGQ